MRLTTQNILKKVRKKILEETDELVTQDQLLEAVNLAYTDIQYAIKAKEQEATTTLTNVSGICALPSDFLSFLGKPKSNDVSLRIVPIQKYKEDLDNVSVVGNTMKVPLRFKTITLNYIKKFDDLDLSNAPETPELFDEVIVYGAIHRLFEDLQDIELSGYYGNKYLALLEQKTAMYGETVRADEETQLFDDFYIEL